MTAILALADDRKAICRAFHVLESKFDDASLRFQFGLFNPDYPAPIRQRVFTLDYDMYSNLIMEQRELLPKLDEFHEKLSSAFESIITDQLRELMEPTNGSRASV